MAQQPYIIEKVTDGALGLVSGDAKKTFALVGICSLLAANTVLAVNNLQALRDNAGVGPGVEQTAQVLQEAGGAATVLLVSPTPTAGSLVAGAPSVGALGTILDSASAPVDDIDLVVKIVKAGAVGTATFAYSTDNGRTFSPEIATGATYAIPGTGITLAFSSVPGSFVAGHTYPFEAKGPSFTVLNLGAALDALLADDRDFSLLHVVGIPADTVTHASVAAAVQAKLEDAAVSLHRPARAFIDPPEAVSDSALKAAVASIPVSTKRVWSPGGFCPLDSLTNPGRIEKRPAAWPIFARACSVDPGTALHATALGPLSRVRPLKSRVGDPVQYAYHDESNAAVSFIDGRIAALRTWAGQPGVYVSRAVGLAALTSDFSELHHARIVDEMQRIGYRTMFPRVGAKLRVDATTGRIDEKQALAIEAQGRADQVRGMVNTGFVQDVQFAVERGDNLIATKLIRYRARGLPFGYGDYVEGEFGLFNPAIG
jgi:hypothetical protein